MLTPLEKTAYLPFAVRICRIFTQDIPVVFKYIHIKKSVNFEAGGVLGIFILANFGIMLFLGHFL